MQIRKILVPTDFSDSSDAALEMASSLARDNNAKLLIVHVHEPEIIYAQGLGIAYSGLADEQRSNSSELLNYVTPANPSVDFERRMINGVPADAIVEFAKNDDFIDLIVLGTHGRTGMSRLLMGSVAEAVVRKAPCPVLTIKESNQTPATSLSE